MEKQDKLEKVFARVTVTEREELQKIARQLDVPASHIVRTGLRTEMKKLRKRVDQ